MAKIHFVDHHGETRIIEVENGATVMEAAIRNAVPGIEAECGGACACATCHVYVDEAWREKVGPPSPMEEDMLDFGFDVRPNSRLSCQIKVSDELDGLVVSTPERQAQIIPIIAANAARLCGQHAHCRSDVARPPSSPIRPRAEPRLQLCRD